MHAPPWMKPVLWLAAIYNIAAGGFAVLFPLAWFRWIGMEEPNHPAIWQCLGMVIAVYGVGYAIAAGNPRRHWPIVLVGLLGKTFGPMGFVFALVRGELPWEFGLLILLNDVIWWMPFAMILRHAWRVRSG